MFATSEMSRLTVAAPIDKMAEILRICTDLSCIHIEEYGRFEDGIGVGKSMDSEDANSISALLVKVQAVSSAVAAFNTDGAFSREEVVKMLPSFEDKTIAALEYIDSLREAEASIATSKEQHQVLNRLAPLDLPLELMGGFEGIDVFVGETSRALKANDVFSDIVSEIEIHAAGGLIAIACRSSQSADVQIGMAELGAKAVQIPAGEGSPAEKASVLLEEISRLESKIVDVQDALDAWVFRNGAKLVAVEEYLVREVAIHTAPTLVAVSNQAFALDGWVPADKAEMVSNILSKVASHVSVEAYVGGHHHHEEDDDHAIEVPIELTMLSSYLQKSDQTIFQFFKAIDLDDSGLIDGYEFQNALKNAEIANLPPWEMGKLVSAVDLDGDGKINLPELDITLTRIRNTPTHDDAHYEVEPPIQYTNGSTSEPFELMVDLIGRPKYGTFDPTMLMMMTFPFIYGMILGDWGYGIIILLLAAWLGSKAFAVNPLAQKGIIILRWMGVWCIIWGVVFAEGFGFIWDHTGQMGSSSPFTGFYEWTYANIHVPQAVAELLNLGGLHMPFHRASEGHGLQEYVVLSIYLGTIHIFIGFILGLINVYKAHGAAAAYFEKGSCILILIGGFMQCRNMVSGYNDLFELQIWSVLLIVGIASFIVGLAIFEKFGWVGGLILGPIETFGILANTLSYLRIMAVGVAGVKIAEVSITMGFEPMLDALTNGGAVGYLTALLCLVLFLGIQFFAIALGILSPAIHAARLHFVEWMGKFYDGSGRAFAPLGGRNLHVENTYVESKS
jgi:vacuolar-type H+-ATPase subunit I/STV1